MKPSTLALTSFLTLSASASHAQQERTPDQKELIFNALAVNGGCTIASKQFGHSLDAFCAGVQQQVNAIVVAADCNLDGHCSKYDAAKVATALTALEALALRTDAQISAQGGHLNLRETMRPVIDAEKSKVQDSSLTAGDKTLLMNQLLQLENDIPYQIRDLPTANATLLTIVNSAKSAIASADAQAQAYAAGAKLLDEISGSTLDKTAQQGFAAPVKKIMADVKLVPASVARAFSDLHKLQAPLDAAIAARVKALAVDKAQAQGYLKELLGAHVADPERSRVIDAIESYENAIASFTPEQEQQQLKQLNDHVMRAIEAQHKGQTIR
jgi:hypothetical protein